MSAGVVIREEAPADAIAVRSLIGEAFRGAPYASGTEAAIHDRLRGDGDLVIGLVADVNGTIVGQIAFSPVTAGGASGWLGLGPVAVTPRRQGRGIGAMLVREGLARAGASVARGVVLIGDPGYYARFGFEGGVGLTYGAVPAPYVQALSFGDPVPTGPLTYAPAFDLA